MAFRHPAGHIDSGDLHAIHPAKRPHSMSAKASPTAAAAPVERRQQPVAGSAIAHSAMANAIRALAMDAVEQAKSGHPGMPMGMADVATILFTRFLKFSPGDPAWPDRDRFVLSAGHGSMLIYALLYLTGYEAMTIDQIKRFRQLGSNTAGHPEYGHAPGIETTTGPLGQGISNSVGLALAGKMAATRVSDGAPLIDYKVYALASDGDLMEGVAYEACSLAGHLKLDNLIVIYDANNITIDGKAEDSFTENVDQRFTAQGWTVQHVDGHDERAVHSAIEKAKTADRPALIIAKTHIGIGAPTKQDTSGAHGAPLGKAEVEATKKAFGWPVEPTFYVPPGAYAAFKPAHERNLA